MIFDASVDGRIIRVEVRGKDGRYAVTLDGRRLDVDLHEAGGDFISLLVDGRSYDVGIEPREGGYAVVLADDTVQVHLAPAARGTGAAVGFVRRCLRACQHMVRCCFITPPALRPAALRQPAGRGRPR